MRALALQGRLVPQDPRDEPAEKLLARIATEKRDLVAKKVIRKPRKLPALTKLSAPHQVPTSWAWTYLALAVPWDLTDGDWVESKDQSPDGEVRLTQLADVGVGRFKDKSSRFLTPETATRLNCTYLQADDVLIARLPRPLGRACVFPGLPQPAVTVVDVAVARLGTTGVYGPYLVHALNSPCLRAQVASLATGTTRKRVSTGNLRKLAIPIPPLAEQQRIVTKVDELLALCDELAAQQEEQKASRELLNSSALDALLNASDPDEFETHWQRIYENFDLLYDVPETVEKLRLGILGLAIRGKLVAQDPTDERPDELLLAICEATGRDPIQLAKSPPERAPELEVPETWFWARVPEVAGHRLGKMLDKEKNSGQPQPYLRNTNVHWFHFDLSSIKGMLLEPSELTEYEVRPGDVLICEGGHGIARTAVWDGQVEQIMFQKALHRVRPSECLNGHFLSFCLRVYEATGYLETFYTGAGIPHFTGRSLAKVPFPLPPIQEQRRIVAEVHRLFHLCDVLEESLQKSRKLGEKLVGAVVHDLVSSERVFVASGT